MIRRPSAILALLTGLNLLNYLDRLVVSAVLPKMQEELALSNFVGGLLATVFLVGYMLTSPIFGALGDRTARKGLIAIGVLVWSVATLASGFATTATGLVVARAFVGVGEASYATLAPTIIDDVSAPEKKGRALSIFYAAMPLGAALGYVVGGLVEKFWGWRSAFFVAGGPGIALAFSCLLIAEPARAASLQESGERPDVLRDLKKLLTIPLYRKTVAGYCAYTAAIGAFSFWAPKFLYAHYQLPLATANARFGVVLVVAGVLGTILGGRYADRRQIKTGAATEDDRVRTFLWVCALSSGLGAPLAAACFLSPTATLFFVFAFFCILVLFLSTSPVNGAILRSVPTGLRASAMALSIFAIHVLGDLWSPALVGFLADHAPIHLAMMTLAVAIGVSAWLWRPSA